MNRMESDILRFAISVITEFAKVHGLSQKQSHNYLARFKGLAHLIEFYNVLHTQSYEDNVEVLTQICLNNGGAVR